MANFRIWIFLVHSLISYAVFFFFLFFSSFVRYLLFLVGNVEIYYKVTVLRQCVILSFGLSIFRMSL